MATGWSQEMQNLTSSDNVLQGGANNLVVYRIPGTCGIIGHGEEVGE